MGFLSCLIVVPFSSDFIWRKYNVIPSLEFDKINNFYNFKVCKIITFPLDSMMNEVMGLRLLKTIKLWDFVWDLWFYDFYILN